ncbi:MAG: type II toxin-antitoxin system HicA family toxin [Rickettsiales bacterium]|nr:type II toxin-antitoxin system HicA family toxin [Rickettsiales bacterium]
MRANGSHRHYNHPIKPGTVTIPMHKGTMSPKTAKSIPKQAGLK